MYVVQPSNACFKAVQISSLSQESMLNLYFFLRNIIILQFLWSNMMQDLIEVLKQGTLICFSCGQCNVVQPSVDAIAFWLQDNLYYIMGFKTARQHHRLIRIVSYTFWKYNSCLWMTAPFFHLASRLRLWRYRTYKSESEVDNIENTSLLVIFHF